MKRNNVVNRNATSVGQKVADDAPDRCDTFLHEMKDLPPYDQYYNMDETPCYFDILRSKTFDFRGVQTVKIKTTGHEKLRFTSALTAALTAALTQLPLQLGLTVHGDGGYKAIRLPPLLIFKKLKNLP